MVQEITGFYQEFFLFGEEFPIMVPDQIMHFRPFHIAPEIVQMVKTFVVGCRCRDHCCGEQGIEFHGDQETVFHGVFGRPRMDVDAFDGDFGACGIEIFIIDHALFSAVDGVGIIRAALSVIEKERSFTDFFVGREDEFHFAMLNAGVFNQCFRQRHHFRYSRLVVGSEQGRAVGDNQALAFQRFQKRKVRGFHDDAEFPVQNDVAAVIVFDDAGLNVFAAEIRGSVEVGDESDRGMFSAFAEMRA